MHDAAISLDFEFPVQLRPSAKTEEPQGAEDLGREHGIHPLVRALVLAHRIDAMIREGAIRNHAEAARWLGVTRARVAQISALLLLAPSIQEAILSASRERGASLSERKIRPVAATSDWAGQAALWAKL